MSESDGERERVLVVGNGMVGQRFCDELTQRDTARQYSVNVVGEEPVPAYDRVHLTDYLASRDGQALTLASVEWYRERGIELRLAESIETLDLEGHRAFTSSGAWVGFDHLVLATGSRPFVPPIVGIDKPGVFVYRTIEDLDRIAAYARSCRTAAVLGGGLLGLEAAKAVLDLGLLTHVLEFAPRLMPRQLDKAAASLLATAVEALGVRVHLGAQAERIEGNGHVESMTLADGTSIDVDMVIVSAGIRPRDELARDAGIEVHPRGGIVVNDGLATNVPRVYAIGECAAHRGASYGLVAPGYAMAEALARSLCGEDASFTGSDMSTKLKLLGVDVASFGNPLDEDNGNRCVSFEDHVQGVYKKLVVSSDCSKLIGGILVGDTKDYVPLLQMTKAGQPLSGSPEELLMGTRRAPAATSDSPAAIVCSCNNVSVGSVKGAISHGCGSLQALKSNTRAGTGCGGCLASLQSLLDAELSAAGHEVRRDLCEHFPYDRQALFEIVKVTGARSFAELLASHGKGLGCEICKPTVASLLASVHNDLVLNHDTIQDTNDRFLANIQRGGLYSVVPRIPGGEITPDKLIVLGQVAKKYGLYTKITGGQRIDLLGAELDQLPAIWEELVQAGFESGHAYGKAVRTVKSCVGTAWCRYGVQDSVGFAIRIENRYKGIRAPHKLKSAVSGCTRECAEARSKDFGLIATEKGYNLYVCGNGGMTPRHADLLASDLDEDTAIRYIDRFLMFYIRTADRLTRTSKWLEALPGGIEHLRSVIVEDALGLGETLEREMNALVESYTCEWAAAVNDAQLRSRFRHFANASPPRRGPLVEERGQGRPADWPRHTPSPRRLPVLDVHWVPMAAVHDFPKEGGLTFRYGAAQIAVFNFSSRGEWYATVAQCPHKGDMVLGRGLIGDDQGRPKVACPHHKKTFSLATGECLSGDAAAIRTFPVKVEGNQVMVELPPIERSADLVSSSSACLSAGSVPHEQEWSRAALSGAPGNHHLHVVAEPAE